LAPIGIPRAGLIPLLRRSGGTLPGENGSSPALFSLFLLVFGRQLFRWSERSDSSDLPWPGSLAMDYGPTDSSGELH
ncbi:hypothetical protein BHE74_00056161, partial [Ensete ventricosum]